MTYEPPYRPPGLIRYSPPSRPYRREWRPYMRFVNDMPQQAPEEDSSLFLDYADRFKHLYVPGNTGMGKSTQLLVLAVQDIQNGYGLTVIDPKGDLVNDLLHYIPEERIKDTIYLDLETPIPLDFLSFNGDTEKDELVEDLVFLLLSDAGNAPRAKSILTNVLYAILGSKEPTSFLDIVRFLTDKKRMDEILAKLDDEDIRQYWKGGIPKDEKTEPIISRMTKYVRNSTLRVVFGTSPSKEKPILNIAEAMNSRKILLVNLGGASRAALDYGSLLFMKMKQEVFRRHKKPSAERVPHLLFVDEFHKFAKVEDFKDVLMMARSYGLGMTLANPSYYDLPEYIKPGIGTMGGYICFRLDPHDLSFFKNYYRADDQEYLMHLPELTAYYKIKGRTGLITECSRPVAPPYHYSEWIKKNTVAQYAQERLIGTNLSPSCNTAPNPQNEGDAKGEEITPSGVSRISLERKPPKRH